MLENINLGIEFIGHNIDPVVPVPEYVTAQTGDISFIIISTLIILGVIGILLFVLSYRPLLFANTQGCHFRLDAKQRENANHRLYGIFAALLSIVLICSFYFSTKAFAGNNDANIDVTPDNIQVVVDGDTSTIQEAVFYFENNSDNFYLFDKTTSMSLTPEAAAITQAADWELQLTALETDLYKGAPDGSDYTVPGNVVTLMPHTSAQAVLKFNKSDFETAKKLVGIKAFTLTMIPDQKVVGIPTITDTYVYNGQSQTAIAETEAYTVTNGSGTNAQPYNAEVTLKPDYKWPDKSTTTQTISWTIAPLPVALSWDKPSLTYSGEAQHPTATVTNIKGSDVVAAASYSYPEGYDGISAKEQKVNVATLGGTSASNYTLEGATENENKYTIAKKALTITADNKEKMEGAEKDPELTATFDGLVHEESFILGDDYSITRQTATEEHAGDTFDITVAVLQGSQVAENYSITTKKGTLTIIPKNPVITPNAISKTYGISIDPALTATVENTEEGFPLVIDTDFTLTREAGENAGEYKITVTLNQTEHVKHYDTIDLKEGTFTINKLAANFKWSSETFTYNKNRQHPTATIKNIVLEDDVSVGQYIGVDSNMRSAGIQKCKVYSLVGESADNYSLDDITNFKSYTISKADIAMTLSVNGDNVTQPRNYQDVKLEHTLSITFGPEILGLMELSYQWYEASSFEGQQSEISGANEDTYNILKDSYVGQKYYFLKVTINPHDDNFNITSKTSTNEKYVKFVYTAMSFNDQLTNTTTTLYTKYATDELYTGETSTEAAEIPTATKPDFVFDGWFTGASDGSRVVDFEKQIVPETIDGYVKDGKWANTEAKTIYAHFYQAQYMTFTNQAEGENTISFNFTANSWSNLPSLILRVSKDAETWNVVQTDVSGTFEIAKLSALNDKVYVAGYNPNGFSSDSRIGTFSSTGKFSVSGNYMALIDYTRSDINAIPNDYCFQQLFKDCSNLTSVPPLDFTFDKENQSHCLNQMFENCSLINNLEVTFKQWPANGFQDWVKGVASKGTFICPDELIWKVSNNAQSSSYEPTSDFCPLNFHNSLGEGRYYYNSANNSLRFYVDGDESHDTFGIVPLDNTADNVFPDAASIKSITYSANFAKWTVNLRSICNWFKGFQSVESIDLHDWKTSNISAANSCFESIGNCKTLYMSDWKLENCKYSNMMFCSSGNLSKIFTNMDTDWSKITYSSQMFKDCLKLPKYSSDTIDASKAKNCLYGGYFVCENQGMMNIDVAGKATFYTIEDNLSFDSYYFIHPDSVTKPWSSTKITSIESTENFRNGFMPNVKSIAGWFEGSKITSFSYYPIFGMNAQSITDMTTLLANCSNLETAEFSYVAQNVDASNLLAGCSKITQLDLGTFCNAKKLDRMCWGCTGLKNVKMGAWGGVYLFLESAQMMFMGCSSLERVDASNMYPRSGYKLYRIQDCSYMFSGCSSLKYIYCLTDTDNWYEFLSGKNTSYMFDGCTSLPHYSDSSPKDAQWAKADNGTEGYFTVVE